MRALLAAMVATTCLVATSQEIQPPKREWVVIFNKETDEKPYPVTLNIRLIVYANGEGDAVLTSMKQLRKIMDERFCDSLQYIEAQERKK